METWLLSIFATPLVMGVLLVLSLAVGMADPGAEGDAHVELDANHGHELLALFGWGRTPLLVSLTVVLLLFGSCGFVGSWFGLPGFLAVPVSALATYLMGGWLTRWLVRLLPTLETKSAQRFDFVGQAATVVLRAEPKRLGLIQVSVGGDLYQFSYRHTGRVEFDPGDHVVVADIDPQTRICTVMDDPTRWGD